MTPIERFFLRLRRRALRLYELGLYATLVALALSLVWPGDAPAFAEADAQCGQIQSSAVVMKK